MHTINGFYDPLVLSEDDIFSTEGGNKILFLIMRAETFKEMAEGNLNSSDDHGIDQLLSFFS